MAPCDSLIFLVLMDAALGMLLLSVLRAGMAGPRLGTPLLGFLLEVPQTPQGLAPSQNFSALISHSK